MLVHIRSVFAPQIHICPLGVSSCKLAHIRSARGLCLALQIRAHPLGARFFSSLRFPLYLYCRDSSKRRLADGANFHEMRQVCDFCETDVTGLSFENAPPMAGQAALLCADAPPTAGQAALLLQTRRQRRSKRRSFVCVEHAEARDCVPIFRFSIFGYTFPLFMSKICVPFFIFLIFGHEFSILKRKSVSFFPHFSFPDTPFVIL